MENRTAQEIIAHLGLPRNTDEKGYLAQSFRDPSPPDGRGASTAAYYLLEGSAGPSAWHRVDAAEVWHYYAGAPIALSSWVGAGGVWHAVLGPDIFRGQRPQIVIRAGEWQSARCEGEWTLAGTTVAPGFVDSSIEFADPGWEPLRS